MQAILGVKFLTIHFCQIWKTSSPGCRILYTSSITSKTLRNKVHPLSGVAEIYGILCQLSCKQERCRKSPNSFMKLVWKKKILVSKCTLYDLYLFIKIEYVLTILLKALWKIMKFMNIIPRNSKNIWHIVYKKTFYF